LGGNRNGPSNSAKDQAVNKYSLWDILLVFLFVAFLESILYLLFPRGIPLFFMLILTCCYTAGILAWTLKYRKWTRSDLGLVNLLDERSHWTGIGVGLFLVFVLAGIDTNTVYLLLHEPKLTGHCFFLLLFLLPALTLISALEELVFRGFLFTLIKNRFGLFAGIVLSSLVFSLAHTVGVSDPSAESIYATKAIAYVQKFVLGVAFAYFFAKTGSLSGPTLAHIVFNWCGVIVYTLAYCPK